MKFDPRFDESMSVSLHVFLGQAPCQFRLFRSNGTSNRTVIIRGLASRGVRGARCPEQDTNLTLQPHLGTDKSFGRSGNGHLYMEATIGPSSITHPSRGCDPFSENDESTHVVRGRTR